VATRLIGAAILGLVFGFAGAQLLHLQWATLIPWGLGALGVGAVCRDRNEALVAGAVYGFALGLTFMTAGYNGTDPVAGKLPFFVLIGVVCAAFGAVAAFVGWWRWHQMGGRAS
jgi:hypothetical protein